MRASLLTAPNQFLETGRGIRYAYRRFGKASDVPLVFLQHFRGNIDNWDPSLIDALAKDREVVLFDNTGVGLSTGETPSSIEQMARDAISFLGALGLTRVDLLGYSIGGFVAQRVALVSPGLVRKLVLASTAPQGAPGIHGWRADILEHASNPQAGAEDVLYFFFKHTPTSQAKGVEFLTRAWQRSADRDQPTDLDTRDAQYDAVVEWGIPDHGALERLAGIAQPVFVANGDDDQMIPPRYSYLLAGLLPHAQIKIYPDSAHGFLFQYANEFADDVNQFLNAE